MMVGNNGTHQQAPQIPLDQLERFACVCGCTEWVPVQVMRIVVNKLARQEVAFNPALKHRCLRCARWLMFTERGPIASEKCTIETTTGVQVIDASLLEGLR